MWGIVKAIRDLIVALSDQAAALNAHRFVLRQNTAAVLQHSEGIRQLNAAVLRLLARLSILPKPGPLSILVTAEHENVLTFQINLPSLPEEPNDIASGELTVAINGGAPSVFPTTKEQVMVDGLRGDQGLTVEASFKYIDDAGNPSGEPATLSVVLVDTIPPPNPGELGLTVTGEE